MSVWEEIKSKLKIEDVFATYTTLTNKGSGNYGCKCPFHNEKTASLIISTDKQIWHCFGCGIGGDMFNFVSLVENISLKESLVKLANVAGVKLEDGNTKVRDLEAQKTQKDITTKKLLLLEWTKNLYHQNLLKELQNVNSEITKYCLARGLNIEIIKKFQLGLAPNFSIITSFVQKDKEKQDLLAEIGLVN